MHTEGIIGPLMLSLKVSALATCLSVTIGLTASYLLARYRFIGHSLFDTLMMLPLVLPPTVTGYYLVLLFGRHGIIGGPLFERFGITVMFSWQAAVIASFVVSLPLMVKAARSAIESVDEDLIRASYTLGHGEVRTALSVTIPLASRGILAGAVLSFARALGEFGATLMLAGNIPGRTDTMPIAIYTRASSGDWSEANVLVLVFTLISISILLFSTKLIGRAV